MAAELDLFLQKRWQNQLLSQESLDLEELIALWKSTSMPAEANGSINEEESDCTELRAAIHDKVGIFWALLLLSAQSKVELTQEEFYQDIQIRAFVQGNNSNSSQKREQGTGNREQETGN
jgi:segregation and condensation protein A